MHVIEFLISDYSKTASKLNNKNVGISRGEPPLSRYPCFELRAINSRKKFTKEYSLERDVLKDM